MAQSSNLADKARQHAAELGEQAQETVTQEAIAQAHSAQSAAAGKISEAANATEAAADQFDPGSPQAEAMRQVADQIEDVAAKLRDADVRQIANEATEYARRNPLLFLGGAALAGFAAARFLKARDPAPTHRAAGMSSDPWTDDAHADGTAMSQINGEPGHA